MKTPSSSVFITGAASGIGRATAVAFTQAGWRVGLADLDLAPLAALAAELGPQTSAYRVDVTEPAQVQTALAAFCPAGTLDVLVNNAGLLSVGRFESIALARHKQLVDVNVTGVINCAHAAHAYLKAARGLLINLSSASAIFGTPDFASYSATKFAVRGLTEALAAEWGRDGIAVCDIMPPFVRTAMIDGQTSESRFFSRLGVNLTPDQVAHEIVGLARRRSLHNPVSLPIRLMYGLAKLTPDGMTARVMRLLSGH
ncbi:SDR family oxidoreductase [Chitinivorax sp. PXF-14]|uniref:SDR family oxidoreductase n=1 Tax=Chitinivorax sp. PXF-14 TaxID=3230488 RepID=UPI003467C6B2